MALTNRQTAELILKASGFETQRDKCIEECSELIRAICRDDVANIIEEMADVLITMRQMTIAFDIEADILKAEIRAKEKRTLSRLGIQDPGIKICPFCKGTATVQAIPGSCDCMYIVECEKCGSSTKVHDTEEEAIEAWNSRT